MRAGTNLLENLGVVVLEVDRGALLERMNTGQAVPAAQLNDFLAAELHLVTHKQLDEVDRALPDFEAPLVHPRYQIRAPNGVFELVGEAVIAGRTAAADRGPALDRHLFEKRLHSLLVELVLLAKHGDLARRVKVICGFPRRGHAGGWCLVSCPSVVILQRKVELEVHPARGRSGHVGAHYRQRKCEYHSSQDRACDKRRYVTP